MSESLFACLYQPPLPGQLVRGVGSSDPTMPAVAGSPALAGFSDPELRTRSAGSEDPAPRTQLAGSKDPAPRTQPVQHTRNPLVAIAAEFSPRYEQHRADLVSIDVRGLSRLFGSPRAIGAEMRREA